MSLDLKNDEVVSLANEVALLAHETKTEAVRRSLEERRERLLRRSRRQPLSQFLEQQVWPLIPPDVLERPSHGKWKMSFWATARTASDPPASTRDTLIGEWFSIPR